MAYQATVHRLSTQSIIPLSSV